MGKQNTRKLRISQTEKRGKREAKVEIQDTPLTSTELELTSQAKNISIGGISKLLNLLIWWDNSTPHPTQPPFGIIIHSHSVFCIVACYHTKNLINHSESDLYCHVIISVALDSFGDSVTSCISPLHPCPTWSIGTDRLHPFKSILGEPFQFI